MTVASPRLRSLAMDRWEMASESYADEMAVECQLLFSYEMSFRWPTHLVKNGP